MLSNSTNIFKFKLWMWVFYLHRDFFKGSQRNKNHTDEKSGRWKEVNLFFAGDMIISVQTSQEFVSESS